MQHHHSQVVTGKALKSTSRQVFDIVSGSAKIVRQRQVGKIASDWQSNQKVIGKIPEGNSHHFKLHTLHYGI